MKEFFETPVYEIVLFPCEDVVCASKLIEEPNKGGGGVSGPIVPLP